MNYQTTLQEISLIETIKKAEELYYKIDLPKIREKITELKKEFSDEWKSERRTEYLRSKILEYQNELKFYNKQLNECFEKNCLWLVNEEEIKKIERKKERTEKELLMIEEKISPELIEKCREIDIGELVEIKKRTGNLRLAICPFHNDKNPSLVIYQAGKGFHCFACDAHGKNAIDFIMKSQNMNFIQAVNFLKTYV